MNNGVNNADYQSKFSKNTLDVLNSNGWTSARHIDAKEMAKQNSNWQNRLPIFSCVFEFWEKFGALEIVSHSNLTDGNKKNAINIRFPIAIFDKNKTESVSARIRKKYEDFLSRPLYWIGDSTSLYADLYMDQEGYVYGVFTEYVSLFGIDGYEAIENMISQPERIKYLGELP